MISLQDFRLLTRPIFNKLFLIIGRGILEATDPGSTAGKSNQFIKATFLKDETLGAVSQVQPYGMESRPVEGAEVIGLFLNGNRDQGVVLAIGDRRFRPITLESGEVVLYSKFGNSILLKDDGSIEIIVPGNMTEIIGGNKTETIDGDKTEIIGGISNETSTGKMTKTGDKIDLIGGGSSLAGVVTQTCVCPLLGSNHPEGSTVVKADK